MGSLSRATPSGSRHPQSSRSTQNTSQSTQLLEEGVSYTFETLDDKLKNSEVFDNLRQLLEHELNRLGLINPRDSRSRTNNRYVKINNIIILPHVEFCRNKRFVEEEHSWLPAPGGYLLIKYRRAVVLRKIPGYLKLGTFTTFSKTGVDEKRNQTVFDEDQNQMVPLLSQYVHIVAVDNTGKSKDCPECFMGGVPVCYRAAANCRPSKFKDSFMNLKAPYFMSDGTPFTVVGHVEDSRSSARLDHALDAISVQTRSARTSATEEMRREEERIETSRAAQLEHSHGNNQEQQASAFNEAMYDDHSAPSSMPPPPPPKRRKADSPSHRGYYFDQDAPEPRKLITRKQPVPTSAANGSRHGSRRGSQPPNTAFGGLNVNSNARGRSGPPYGDQYRPRGSLRY